jgi:protein involved in polysaccharide export with SLBB domain
MATTFIGGRLRRAAVALVWLVAAAGAAAQAPSADQMEAFRKLPADQQQAILESLGSKAGGVVTRDADLAVPETSRPSPKARAYDDIADREDDSRIRGLDTVLLDVRVQPADAVTGKEISDGARSALQGRVALILKGNPYKLDSNGVLRIPGVPPIPLAGLSEAQATARLGSEPLLSGLGVRLSLLPLAKLDSEALRPFGYDLFAGSPSTFAPVTDVPVPSEYVVGPGDRFEVQLVGNTKARYSLVVNRDGQVMFPELGPVAVSGLKFDQARGRIESRVSEQMIGTRAVISMGDLRAIRVFVLGEAERPGSYTVGGLATITNALFACGGVKTIGSLRNIQLKRGGALVQRLDLYDLLLDGDTSEDVRLLPGDVIFIPPVGPTAGVTGEIRRPAIYELKGENTVADLLHLGGGLTPEADPRLGKLERIDERRDRVVLDVDLSSGQARGTRLRSGDVLRIPAARPTYANAIQLKGHVYRPTSFQYRSGLRLTDVLPSVQELKPNADLHYVLIQREDPDSRQVSVISADLEQAWKAPRSDANPLLEPRDQVIVFDQVSGRSQYMAPVLDGLRLQAVSTEPSQIVRVTGHVRAPGDYPLEQGMRVRDLVRAGGGLAQQAYGGEAELVRFEVRDGQKARTEVLKIDVSRALAGDPANDVVLAPFDTLVVKQISEWGEQEVLQIEGQVVFPGEYPIVPGETLKSVIARAGGLTSRAFPQGSVFTREALKEQERQQISSLTERMRLDLATLALQASQTEKAGGQAADSLAIGQSLLKDLQAAQPVGRLVIDLDRVLASAPGSADDLTLRNGDRLRIPMNPQEVTVIGEVQSPTSHVYNASLSREDYLRLSGGPTEKADDKRIYVVRANGSVEAGTGSNWFRSGVEMRPGDTIVVPLDTERMRPLPLWTSVTTIIYNLAVAVAAIGSL